MQQFTIPNPILKILERLADAGHAAYLVGGCVRDMLLGVAPHDWDICTAARPDQVCALFPDTLDHGARHGTVTVREGGLSAEVTTFRAEGTYTDHRRPDAVRFLSDLRADLARRDFTVNAMAMDADGVLTDPFGGQTDLENRILRAVGEPERRFQEDALRRLRAIRFSAQLDLSIEAETAKAIRACAPLMASLSAERICAELDRTLRTRYPERLAAAQDYGLLAFPARLPWDKLHTAPEGRTARWMAFSLALTEAGCGLSVLETLRLDKRTALACRACAALFQSAPRTEQTWKAAVAAHGAETAALSAEVLSAWEGSDDAAVLRTILRRGDCCTLRELAISGTELRRLGIQGPEIGRTLNRLLRHVWAYPEDNQADILLTLAREEKTYG